MDNKEKDRNLTKEKVGIDIGNVCAMCQQGIIFFYGGCATCGTCGFQGKCGL